MEVLDKPRAVPAPTIETFEIDAHPYMICWVGDENAAGFECRCTSLFGTTLDCMKAMGKCRVACTQADIKGFPTLALAQAAAESMVPVLRQRAAPADAIGRLFGMRCTYRALNAAEYLIEPPL